jgi:hypothetical protein
MYTDTTPDTDHPETPDLGSDGPAYKVRSYVDETIASGETAIGKETTQRRHYTDALLIDKMLACNWINQRQHAAGVILAEMYHASQIEPKTTASYEKERRGRSLNQRDDDQPEPMDSWLRCSEEFESQCWLLISKLVRNENPGIKWVASIRSVLDRAADLLGLPTKAKW